MREDLDNVGAVSNCAAGTSVKQTTWAYGHNSQIPEEFGQLLVESDGFVERHFDYDEYARSSTVQTRFITRGSVNFVQGTTYDEFGRVFQRFDGSPDHGGLRYGYNARGYQTQLLEASDPVRRLG